MQKEKIAALRRSLQVMLMLTTILIFMLTITPPSSSQNESEIESLTESEMELLMFVQQWPALQEYQEHKSNLASQQ